MATQEAAMRHPDELYSRVDREAVCLGNSKKISFIKVEALVEKK